MEEIYPVQRIEKTYPEAIESIARVLIDFKCSAQNISVCELAYKIAEKIGFDPRKE